MNHYGYIKCACASIPLTIANVKENTKQILNTLSNISEDTRIVVFPELCLTSSTCGDLLFQQTLLKASMDGLQTIIQENESDALLAVGLPFAYQNHLYNCVAFIYQHQLLAMMPKSHLSNTEQRWFTSGEDVSTFISLLDFDIPFSANLSIHDTFSNAMITCAIGDDLYHQSYDEHIVLHPCNSVEIVTASSKRRDYMVSTSLLQRCGIVSCSSDMSESTTDVLFSGEKFIIDQGIIINEAHFMNAKDMIYGEIDVEAMMMQKMSQQTKGVENNSFVIDVTFKPYCIDQLVRKVSAYPFIPSDVNERIERCRHILAIQAAGLAMRMKKIYCQKLVIGISGGLDSTLALLVCVKAMELLQLDPSNIITITMPGFGTTKRTKGNSYQLMEALGTTIKEISIHDACLQHFKDIEHDPSALDITFENAQARERTQILMDVANKYNALVVGTGDLSELALGWCTYNGDHMSMYAVNGSIPKTLLRYVVYTTACDMREQGNSKVADTLEDILATPVSPELLPPKEDGNIAQETEKSIGSYDYHDFFLYYMLKYGISPQKIFFLAKQAFPNTSLSLLKDTMKTFYRRFFTQQFKRSCMPDGVKVGSLSLSPRGDLKMPSDASYGIWMNEVEQIEI